jgi:hypothetical protein
MLTLRRFVERNSNFICCDHADENYNVGIPVSQLQRNEVSVGALELYLYLLSWAKQKSKTDKTMLVWCNADNIKYDLNITNRTLDRRRSELLAFGYLKSKIASQPGQCELYEIRVKGKLTYIPEAYIRTPMLPAIEKIIYVIIKTIENERGYINFPKKEACIKGIGVRRCQIAYRWLQNEKFITKAHIMSDDEKNTAHIMSVRSA